LGSLFVPYRRLLGSRKELRALNKYQLIPPGGTKHLSKMTNRVSSSDPDKPNLPSIARRPSPVIWIVVGLAVGIGGTLALVRPEKEVKGGSVVSSAATPIETKPFRLTTDTPVKPVSSPVSVPDPEEKKLPDLPIGMSPASPFGASNDLLSQLPKAPAALKGALPKAPMLPPEYIASGNTPAPVGEPGSSYLNDIVDKGIPKAPPALHAPQPTPPSTAVPPGSVKGECDLLTIRETATNPQAQAEEIIAHAKSLQGSADILVERAHAVSQKDRVPIVSGLLVTLPSASVPEFQKRLQSGGAFVDADTWSGTSEARRVRLTQDAKARVASLASLRDALLVTYKEDADAVKDVDEDIARAKKILEQLQADASTDAMAIVRIVFVSK